MVGNIVGNIVDNQIKKNQAKIIWLQQNAREHGKSKQVIQKFLEEGMDIRVVNMNNFHIEESAQFDFVMLEYAGYTNCSSNHDTPYVDLDQTLKNIRLNSLAPLVILIDGEAIERVLHVIESGADAILPINTSTDIILARCQALIRRWMRFK